MKNPWAEKHNFPGSMMKGCVSCGVTDRLADIKSSTDIAWLKRVIKWPDNEKTVQQAAERRLRKLEKLAKVPLDGDGRDGNGHLRGEFDRDM